MEGRRYNKPTNTGKGTWAHFMKLQQLHPPDPPVLIADSRAVNIRRQTNRTKGKDIK